MADILNLAIPYFGLIFIGFACGKTRGLPEAGLAGAYGNIGYMGPGLALAVLGSKAAAPTALIFCCDSIFLFSIVPLLIALSDGESRHWLRTIGLVVRQIVLN